MAAFIALHHARLFNGVIADKYGNDPWVWSSPFLWSHCNARPRAASFGMATHGPLVNGRDAMFFCSWHPGDNELVFDAVLVFETVRPIREVEALYASTHPVRHYHFDQDRVKWHRNSHRTWIADENLSFTLHPAMRLPASIDEHLSPGIPLRDYFAMTRPKSARKIVHNAQGNADQLTDPGTAHACVEELNLTATTT